MKKLSKLFSKHKLRVHFLALILMSSAPILMYFGALDQSIWLILFGLFLMVIANILSLITE